MDWRDTFQLREARSQASDTVTLTLRVSAQRSAQRQRAWLPPV